jgi:Flp pilus assembly protein TadG
MPHMSRHKISSHKLACERGQTMVEFALVAPILCLLLFAIIQFGALYSNYVTLTDATRAGARKAAVSRLETAPAAVAEAAIRNSAKNLDQPCTATAGLCVTVTAAEWEHGQDVTVQATYPYEIDLLGVVLKKGRLKSVTTERVE